jgi:hypothetical protein
MIWSTKTRPHFEQLMVSLRSVLTVTRLWGGHPDIFLSFRLLRAVLPSGVEVTGVRLWGQRL